MTARLRSRWTRAALWLTALAASVTVGAAMQTAPAAAAPSDPWLDLAGLQTLINAHPSGVDGTFRTVVGGGAGGQAPASIPMKVLAIIGNAGPDGALIYFEADMTDPVMAEIGNIASGMSGSPLYVDDGGTQKVIGALSYGDVFATNGGGLATPIEYMINVETTYPVTPAVARRADVSATLGTTPEYAIASLPASVDVAGDVRRVIVARDRVAAVAAPRSDGTAVFAPLAALQIGGLPYDSAAYKALVAKLEAGRHTVLRGLGTGPGGWDPDYQTALIPGAACAAMYSRGEFWAGGIGTVTYVNGNVLMAFGHPMDWSGPSGLYLDNAWIDGIWSSTYSSYKLGEPGKVRGTITQDRGAGIGARLDQTPAEVPVTATATVTSSGVTRTVTSPVYLARSIVDQYFGPSVAAAAVSVPIYKAGDVFAMGGGATTSTVVKVSDGTNQYTVTRANIWDNSADVTYDATQDVAAVLGELIYNAEGVAPATIVSVDYQASVSPQRRLATIVGVSVPGGVQVGGNTVNVTLAPYGSMDDVTIPVRLTLPEGSSTEGVLTVSSARESGDTPMGPEGRSEDETARVAAREIAPRATRTTLAQLAAELNAAPTNADIKVSFQTAAPQPLAAYGTTDYFIAGSTSVSSGMMQLVLSPTTANYGTRTVSLSGSVAPVFEAGTVAVYRRAAGASAWTLVDGAVAVEPQADGSGAFGLLLTGPKKSTTYKAVWAGDSRTMGVSGQAKLAVRAKVTLGGRVLSGGGVKLTAKVAPSQTGRMVAFEKKSGKKWLKLAQLKLKSGSTVSWTWRPAAGSHRVRARFTGSTTNAAATSATLKVIAR
jgi:hypothetical protein